MANVSKQVRLLTVDEAKAVAADISNPQNAVDPWLAARALNALLADAKHTGELPSRDVMERLAKRAMQPQH